MSCLFLLVSVTCQPSRNRSDPPASNLDPTRFAATFETVVDVRLFGFDAMILKEALSSLLSKYIMRVDVVKGASPIYHSFSAKANFFTLPTIVNDFDALIREHFSQNPTNFAVYVIRTNETVRKVTNVVARGDRWIALRFSEAEKTQSNRTTAYRIVSRVFDLFSDIFVRPIQFEPRISVTDNSDKIVIFQPRPLNAFNSVSILKHSISDLADLTITAVEFDTDYLSVVCAVCADSLCAANWLRRLPEYSTARSVGALPLFLLPQSCTHQFAAKDIAFAPTKIQSSLEAVGRKALFGWEPNHAAEPFFVIMARRNMAVYPLWGLSRKLMEPVDEINELSQFNAVPQKVVRSLDGLYGEFIEGQKEYSRKLLDEGVDAAQDEWEGLVNITDRIIEQWAAVSENVQRRRVCVGNLRDLTRHPLIFLRPSFYCLLSLLGSIAMWRIILKLVKPKDVVGLWNRAGPLL
jgi:hypothetical protein